MRNRIVPGLGLVWAGMRYKLQASWMSTCDPPCFMSRRLVLRQNSFRSAFARWSSSLISSLIIQQPEYPSPQFMPSHNCIVKTATKICETAKHSVFSWRHSEDNPNLYLSQHLTHLGPDLRQNSSAFAMIAISPVHAKIGLSRQQRKPFKILCGALQCVGHIFWDLLQCRISTILGSFIIVHTLGSQLCLCADCWTWFCALVLTVVTT